MEETNKFKELKPWLWFGLVALLVIATWIFTRYTLIDLQADDRGTYGDMFGGLNALFSGLAFAGIIFTIILQGKELKLQREELKETREVFEAQTAIMNRQRFQALFFQLIELFNGVNGLGMVSNGYGYPSGLGGLIRVVQKEMHVIANKQKMPEIHHEFLSKFIKAHFLDSHQNRVLFAKYLKVIIQISRFVANSDLIEDSERKEYFDIFKTQLGEDEIVVLSLLGIAQLEEFQDLDKSVLAMDLLSDYKWQDFTPTVGFIDILDAFQIQVERW